MRYFFRSLVICSVIAAISPGCSEGDPTAPLTPETPPRLEGNVAYFCWLDPDGTLHGCEFSCVEPEEEFDSQTGTCSDPNYQITPDDPSPPPGPDGGSPPPVPDTLDVEMNVDCGSGVSRGSTVTCILSLTPSWVPFEIQEWSTVALDFSHAEQTSTNGWSGPAVIDGAFITVDALVGGQVAKASTSLSVDARSWSWSSENSVGLVQGSSHDSCWANSDLGQVVGADCTLTDLNFISPSDAAAWSVTQATSGPFMGLWYVLSTPVRVDLVTVIHPDLRPAGPSYPFPLDTTAAYHACDAYFESALPSSLNLHQVNTQCLPPGTQYAGLIDHTTNHEDRHMTLALQWASNNDLRQDWEDEWRQSKAALEQYLTTELDQAQLDAVNATDPEHGTFQENTIGYTFYAPLSSYIVGQPFGTSFTMVSVTPDWEAF